MAIKKISWPTELVLVIVSSFVIYSLLYGNLGGTYSAHLSIFSGFFFLTSYYGMKWRYGEELYEYENESREKPAFGRVYMRWMKYVLTILFVSALLTRVFTVFFIADPCVSGFFHSEFQCEIQRDSN